MDLRTPSGQFASPRCPDPNCGGTLVEDMTRPPWPEPIMRCDGLTWTDENGPLIACAVEYPRLAPVLP